MRLTAGEPQEAGELSVTLSLRRHVVSKNHAEDIEKLNA